MNPEFLHNYATLAWTSKGTAVSLETFLPLLSQFVDSSDMGDQVALFSIAMYLIRGIPLESLVALAARLAESPHEMVRANSVILMTYSERRIARQGSDAQRSRWIQLKQAFKDDPSQRVQGNVAVNWSET